MARPQASIANTVLLPPLRPLGDAANAYVHAWHRHAQPVVGHLFSLGLFDQDFTLHGTITVGRPVARHLDDKHTVEITRLTTDGTTEPTWSL